MDAAASCRGSEDEIQGNECRRRSEEEECCCCCTCDQCPPHLFTSILLGLLACVLISGGVFLAFHKWDHTWLLVSAVGVLLMVIGTALHCCSTTQNERKGHSCKGGCGSTRSKPDTVSTGLLAEQLLPLSNARSVSQLSLNMLPGYFPPLVYPASSTPYGLEQHSAVVQNINRLVQHQQQLHLQSATSTDGARSFILLPLPADANAANIQNLVAAVCQLDAGCSPDQSQEAENIIPPPTTQIPAASSLPTDSACGTLIDSQENQQPSASSQPLLKHVEVQTCAEWPSSIQPDLKTQQSVAIESASESSAVEQSCTNVDISCQTMESEQLQRTVNVELICLSDTISEVPQLPTSDSTAHNSNNSVCDNEDTSVVVTMPESDVQVCRTVVIEGPAEFSVSSDLLQEDGMSSNLEEGFRNNVVPAETADLEVETRADDLRSADDVESLAIEPGTEDSSAMHSSGDDSLLLVDLNPDQDPQFEGRSNASSSDFEDSDLLNRSSPPPSYDDVTQEEPPPPAGAFGLAYGTL